MFFMGFKIRYSLLFLVAVVGVIALFGCTSQKQNNDVYDYEKFLEELRTNGASVGDAGEIEQAFFSVKGKVVKVNGEDLQVFEYEGEEETNSQASLVSTDGSSIGTSMVSWIDEPHFYKRGRIIVIYIGQNPTTIELISGILGEQFAGWGGSPGVDGVGS